MGLGASSGLGEDLRTTAGADEDGSVAGGAELSVTGRTDFEEEGLGGTTGAVFMVGLGAGGVTVVG
jgi:hypothetical protein